jgi:hypothetical protein
MHGKERFAVLRNHAQRDHALVDEWNARRAP